MSDDYARKIREEIYPDNVLAGDSSPNLEDRMRLIRACVEVNLPILSAAIVVGRSPVSNKDKNWRGRALEAYLGGHVTSHARRDFGDGELKSTRVLGSPGQWRIEQTLRITTLRHTSGYHLNSFESTPFYDKISCFTCVLFDSSKSDIYSGTFVGTFLFRIEDNQNFLSEIKDDYNFYIDEISKSTRVSSRVKSPNGFLGCRQTAGVAGAISATSLYVTPKKFNELLEFYNVNRKIIF